MKKTFLLLVVWFLMDGYSMGSPDVPRRSQTPDGKGVWGELVSLPSRPGVQQRILVVRTDTASKGSLVLFKGGRGGLDPFDEVSDGFVLAQNFLVRSAPLFALQGFLAVIVDTPSDTRKILRESPEHVKDIQAIVSYLTKKGDTPIYLVGTSRGTTSVDYLAQHLQSNHVKGIVLTSSMDSLSLYKTDYSVLFVHHQDDPCFVTSYSNALQSYGRVSSPKKFFVTVRGGSTPRDRDCGPLTEHGFIGKEAEVVKVIADWAKGKAVPKKVGP